MLNDETKLYLKAVEEVCGNEYPKYDNLVIFVDNFLKKKVSKWCNNDYVLRCGNHDEDLMQEIQIRIIKTCEDYFFKPVDGKSTKTCDEFKAWGYRVAYNCFISYLKDVKGDVTDPLPDSDIPPDGDDDDGCDDVDLDEKLQRCFEIVFDLKSSPHIMLTWLSISLFMMENDLTKIESTHMLAERFSCLTLDEMFNMVINLIKRTDFLKIDADHIEKQRQRLEKINEDSGKRFGDMIYFEFYMSKGPEASISDWVNRVNAQIKKYWC